MTIMRNVFLLASQNRWLREHARRYGFMRRTVARFMPGETTDEALAAAHELQRQNIGSSRTADDLHPFLPLGPAIRLVKGACKDPPARALPRQHDVDENFFALSQRILRDEALRLGLRAATATHDVALIRRIVAFAESCGR